MNIFVLDLDIKKCAEYHCDQHMVMIKEAAQMLSTVCRLNGLDNGYKKTHINHCCTIWTGESLSNWLWLQKLSKELNNQHKKRFNHKNNHKSYDVILSLSIPKIKDIGLTSFAFAMPDKFKTNDVVQSYRNFYKYDKPFATWKNGTPKWMLI